MKLHCPICSDYIEMNEKVLLDEINTITHIRCNNTINITVKDIGELEEVIEKYEMFSSLRNPS